MTTTATVDKDTQLTYLKSIQIIGFVLWWGVLLLGALLPEGEISERGRMWLVILAMSYAVLTIASYFWSGYSRKEREINNADATKRKSQVAQLLFSSVFMFVFWMIFRIFEGKSIWPSAVLDALLFAGFMTLLNYTMSLRKSRKQNV